MDLYKVFMVTNNVPAMADFYAKVVGLKLKFIDGDRWAEFEGDGSTFALASPAEGLGAPIGSVIPVFSVENLSARAKEIAAQGWTTTQPRNVHSGRSAILAYDKENYISLIGPKPRRLAAIASRRAKTANTTKSQAAKPRRSSRHLVIE